MQSRFLKKILDSFYSHRNIYSRAYFSIRNANKKLKNDLLDKESEYYFLCEGDNK